MAMSLKLFYRRLPCLSMTEIKFMICTVKELISGGGEKKVKNILKKFCQKEKGFYFCRPLVMRK